MRKWNCGFVMVGLAFLISISVLSCQTDDADDYSQQAEDVTAADLFIASEAYQNLEKEIGICPVCNTPVLENKTQSLNCLKKTWNNIAYSGKICLISRLVPKQLLN